jgi:hypothetical protein
MIALDDKNKINHIEFCDSGKYQPFSKKIFRLRLLSVVDERRTIIDKKTVRYYVIKDSIRLRYKMIALDDKNKIDDVESEEM